MYPQKAKWPLVIFSLRLVLGTPKNAGVTQHFRPLLGLREGKGEAANSDFPPRLALGTPKNAGVT